MQLFRSLKRLSDKLSDGCVATIGNYDGVHLGHQEILKKVIVKAKALKLPSVIIIFEPQPEEFFTNNQEHYRLTSLREKLKIFFKFNINYVLCLRFDIKLVNLSAAQFIEDHLLKSLKVKYLVVGDDFVFGRKREGNFDLLQKYGANNEFGVEKIEQFKFGGVRISSSLIRNALVNDDLKLAETMLGRVYSLCGRVVHGDKRGRDLGFPTANIYLPHKVLPISGVYLVGILGIDKKIFWGVANIGKRPTVGDLKRILEVYVFDFSSDIYGKRIEIEFLKKIRPEKKFSSFALLKQQIADDVKIAKKLIKTSCFCVERPRVA